MRKAPISAHLFVSVPPTRASERLPGSIEALGAMLRIDPTSRPSPVALGVQAARHPATWTRRSLRGEAYVELRCASSYDVEVVVHLEPPVGVRGRLGWTARRSTWLVRALARELHSQMELVALQPVVSPGAGDGSSTRSTGWSSGARQGGEAREGGASG